MADTEEMDSADQAYGSITHMMGLLGDPFTRILRAREYGEFLVGNNAELQGVGVVIGVHEVSGDLVVVDTVDESPAQRAGIMPGACSASTSQPPIMWAKFVPCIIHSQILGEGLWL
jgi:carboxyl-terminal processing protease